METNYNQHDYCDIDAQYLISLFDTLRNEYPTYFILLMHSTCDLFVIHQMYDYRSKKRAAITYDGIDKPLRWISAQEFIDDAKMFHRCDRFRVSLVDGLCIINNQFDADILVTLLRQDIASECKLALHRNEYYCLPDELAAKYGFSPEEQETISGIVDEINKEIISDLQFQYDHLKTLYFIRK